MKHQTNVARKPQGDESMATLIWKTEKSASVSGDYRITRPGGKGGKLTWNGSEIFRGTVAECKAFAQRQEDESDQPCPDDVCGAEGQTYPIEETLPSAEPITEVPEFGSIAPDPFPEAVYTPDETLTAPPTQLTEEQKREVVAKALTTMMDRGIVTSDEDLISFQKAFTGSEPLPENVSPVPIFTEEEVHPLDDSPNFYDEY